MNVEKREFHASPDGDRWYVARLPEVGQAFIQHIPGDASGGQATHIELGVFLARDVQGPEHQAFLRLVGTLVEEPSRADSE